MSRAHVVLLFSFCLRCVLISVLYPPLLLKLMSLACGEKVEREREEKKNLGWGHQKEGKKYVINMIQSML